MPTPAWKNLLTLAAVLGLLVAVNFLPPDTSFRQVREAGVLRVCVPTEFPPLVMRGGEQEGIDVEIVQAVAQDLDLRLSLNTNSAMGRDFNPRNWRVTRAQCQLLAGGVVASPTTRSFLETTSPHMETGWALVTPSDLQSLDGKQVGFFSGISGLDRISLSRYLREQGARASVVNSRADLAEGILDGTFDAGVTEALTARQIAGEHGLQAAWLPGERYPLVLGLWKGDLTLKREVEAALRDLEHSGGLQAILDRYELAPIEEECDVCV